MAKENFDRLLLQLKTNRMMPDDDDDADHTMSDRNVDDRGQNCSFLNDNMFMNKLKFRRQLFLYFIFNVFSILNDWHPPVRSSNIRRNTKKKNFNKPQENISNCWSNNSIDLLCLLRLRFFFTWKRVWTHPRWCWTIE